LPGVAAFGGELRQGRFSARLFVVQLLFNVQL
jgi:hypothetical protein